MSDPPPPLPESLEAPPPRVDPVVGGVLLFAGLVVAGFVLIALGHRSLAARLVVAYQLPGLVSGCVIGLALVATGVGLGVALHGHRTEARLRAANDEALDELAALLAAIRRQGHG